MTTPMNVRSETNLIGVAPSLCEVARTANALCLARHGWEFTIIEGLRSELRQKQLYAQGRTAPGPIVTWTMASRHRKQASGFGEAVDCVRINNGKPIWEDCDKIAACMLEAAKSLGVAITWGADWDRDGKPREKGETDSPHFQLA